MLLFYALLGNSLQHELPIFRNDLKFVIISITSLGKLDSKSTTSGLFHVDVLVELQNDPT